MKDSQGNNRWMTYKGFDKVKKPHPFFHLGFHDCATLEKTDSGAYKIFSGHCKCCHNDDRREFKFVCEIKLNANKRSIQKHENDEKKKLQKEKEDARLAYLQRENLKQFNSLVNLIEKMECKRKDIQKTHGCIGNFKRKCNCLTRLTVEKTAAKKICDKASGKLVELESSTVCEKEIPDTFSHLDIDTLQQCKNNKIQMHFNCTGEGRECLCLTAILQPPNIDEAVKHCDKIKGKIVQRNSQSKIDTNFVNHLIQEKSVEKWDDSFICETNIKDDNLDRVDFDNLKLCQNKRFQKPHKCIASPSKKCKCITFFQQPLEHNNALQICQKMEGTLPNSIFKEELEELILDYWRTQNENTVVKNQQIMFEDKSAMIERSNGKKPHVNILTSSPKKGSFMCMSDINDEYSHIDWIEMKKCSNKKIQKSHQCIGNPKENCKCMTFFQQPLEKNEAIKQCQEMDGNLVNSGFKEQLERSYLDYWKSNSGESFKENKDLIFKNNEYAEINWSNPETPQPLNRQDASKACNKVEGSLVQETSIELERFLEHLETEKSIDIETDNKFIINDTNYIDVKWSAESRKRANIETSKKIEEGSFICVSNISDNTLNPIDFENLKLCKDNRIQKSYECVGNPKENCKCMTFFQQPLEENDAIKQCQEMGGNLVNSGFKEQLERSYLDYWKSNSGESFEENKYLIFKNDEYAEINWSNPKTPQVDIKSINKKMKGSFICSTEIRDEYSQVDFKELKKCFNKKIQKSYECIGNPRENCKCMTFFQGPLEKKEAIQQCQEMGGNLVDISFKQKLEESYLDYWKNKIGKKFKENTDLIFKNDEYAEIKWSNPETPQVDIKSINKKNMGSFICSTKIEDDLSHVDLTELKKCSNSKIQHFYKCAGIKGGKCQCWTAFLKPLNRQDASKECNKVEGSLVQ
ncbi:hypothetical protein QYM36_003151 [Artemia franciscana]|uniref:C-type lectin domain-containing protein n=1 Tax=Artemia franciscana TaxID=6661 RepID=A0AA88I6P2_ARTSF|nr:hypothetical protein QYM36_003151 [Artemia franciscana]